MMLPSLFDPEISLLPSEKKITKDTSSTFASNMSLPVHKWYRYTAGFSASWVSEVINQQKQKRKLHVIDPFAGSGTVLIQSEVAGLESIGIEAQPYIYRIAKAKLKWMYCPESFKKATLHFLEIARKKNIMKVEYPKLIESCFPKEILIKLDALKQTWLEIEQEIEIKDFTWFIITSILRISSPVGTAQWQYIQPNKAKSKVVHPFVAFEKKVYEMYSDMVNMQNNFKNSMPARIYNEDARNIQSIPDGWGNLIITSPPYANNYDYADATRLEMCFWGDITGWTDLQDNVRGNLIRACTQHVSNLKPEIDNLLSNSRLKPIFSELMEVYNNLSDERQFHGGKKNYHFMIAAYFKDLADVFYSLRRVTSENCEMCFVIGDSAPYGIYVPVEKWLGELAIAAGFNSYFFEKTRDRNVKWKNRKHTVPLKEGRLWIK